LKIKKKPNMNCIHWKDTEVVSSCF